VPRLGRDLGAQHRGELGDGGLAVRAGLVGLRVQEQEEHVPLRYRQVREIPEQRAR
jgi:hypothetical protein